MNCPGLGRRACSPTRTTASSSPSSPRPRGSLPPPSTCLMSPVTGTLMPRCCSHPPFYTSIPGVCFCEHKDGSQGRRVWCLHRDRPRGDPRILLWTPQLHLWQGQEINPQQVEAAGALVLGCPRDGFIQLHTDLMEEVIQLEFSEYDKYGTSADLFLKFCLRTKMHFFF